MERRGPRLLQVNLLLLYREVGGKEGPGGQEVDSDQTGSSGETVLKGD